MLVVDDNVDVADLLSEAQQDEGFATAVAYDRQAALETWRNFVPHAGVLDVGLPVLDGYELARALRAEHGPGPTLIAATGYGQHNDRVRAVDAGFDCHLIKPVSVHELVALLDERIAGGTTGAGPLRRRSGPTDLGALRLDRAAAPSSTVGRGDQIGQGGASHGRPPI